MRTWVCARRCLAVCPPPPHIAREVAEDQALPLLGSLPRSQAAWAWPQGQNRENPQAGAVVGTEAARRPAQLLSGGGERLPPGPAVPGFCSLEGQGLTADAAHSPQGGRGACDTWEARRRSFPPVKCGFQEPAGWDGTNPGPSPVVKRTAPDARSPRRCGDSGERNAGRPRPQGRLPGPPPIIREMVRGRLWEPEGNRLLPAVSRLQNRTNGTTWAVHRELCLEPARPGPRSSARPGGRRCAGPGKAAPARESGQ